MRGEVSYFSQSSSPILENRALETYHVTRKTPSNANANSENARYEDYPQMGRYVHFRSKQLLSRTTFPIARRVLGANDTYPLSSCLTPWVFPLKKRC